MKIALVGLGKIANDQHVPVIAGDPDFDLAAVVSRRGLTVGHAVSFRSLADLIEAETGVEAVALCTPPEAHFDAARAALRAGLHVLLEKPPTVTLAELHALSGIADSTGRTLFATWHSRFNAAAERLRADLAGRKVTSLKITWKEDVRRWHPGQPWIWEPSGFGVFDPGINALSILTMIMPEPVFVSSAVLQFPQNRAQPIAAELAMRTESGGDVSAVFDWRQTGPQTWRIELATADGLTAVLDGGGRELTIDGNAVMAHGDGEYAAIYRRFAELVGAGRSEIDVAPLRLVADAFLVGRHETVAPFHDDGHGGETPSG